MREIIPIPGIHIHAPDELGTLCLEPSGQQFVVQFKTILSCNSNQDNPNVLKWWCWLIDETDGSVDKTLHDSRRIRPVDRIADDQQIGFLPLCEKFPELIILDDALLQLPAAATASTMAYGIISNSNEFRLAQIAQGSEKRSRCNI
jgi:hypothetical protein